MGAGQEAILRAVARLKDGSDSQRCEAAIAIRQLHVPHPVDALGTW
jgi:hypothetical protein